MVLSFFFIEILIKMSNNIRNFRLTQSWSFQDLVNFSMAKLPINKPSWEKAPKWHNLSVCLTHFTINFYWYPNNFSFFEKFAISRWHRLSEIMLVFFMLFLMHKTLVSESYQTTLINIICNKNKKSEKKTKIFNTKMSEFIKMTKLVTDFFVLLILIFPKQILSCFYKLHKFYENLNNSTLTMLLILT